MVFYFDQTETMNVYKDQTRIHYQIQHSIIADSSYKNNWD